MKRILTSALLLALTLLGAYAADSYRDCYRNLPVGLRAVEEFTIPARSMDIRDFGAVGDGATLNTSAFQTAIDELARVGGGHIIVPQGIWLTGPFELKSNIDLHLERNAMVIFSPDKSLYVDPNPRASRVRPCISADRCTNISITGSGTLDGNGAQWRPVKRMKVSDVEWRRFKAMGGVERQDGSLWYPWELTSGYPDVADTPERQEKKRNDLFRIYDCENVMLKGVTFQNAPKFHVHPFNSRNIIIDGITVRCPWNAQNGDAIDLSDCHQALIVNTTVDAGDDGLCMKSGDFKKGALVNGCEDILIQDNTVYNAHGGFVIGSEDVCGMTRIVVRNCTFSGTDTGLRFKSGVGRGGRTADIYISGIVMTDIRSEAVIFQCDYADRPAGSKESDIVKPKELVKVPEFTDIHISDVVCRGAVTAIAASGLEGQNCVHDITLTDCTFIYTRNATEIDSATASLTLRNVRLIPEKKD